MKKIKITQIIIETEEIITVSKRGERFDSLAPAKTISGAVETENSPPSQSDALAAESIAGKAPEYYALKGKTANFLKRLKKY